MNPQSSNSHPLVKLHQISLVAFREVQIVHIYLKSSYKNRAKSRFAHDVDIAPMPINR